MCVMWERRVWNVLTCTKSLSVAIAKSGWPRRDAVVAAPLKHANPHQPFAKPIQPLSV